MQTPPSSSGPLLSTPGTAGWLPVWIKAITKPSEQTFVDITDGPEATSKTAFLWVFLAGTLAGIISALLTALLQAAGFSTAQMLEGLEQFTGPLPVADTGSTVSGLLFGLVCSPVAGAVATAFFAVGVGIIQWIAKLFGGTGSFDKLAYGFAAVSVPATLVGSILSPLSVIPTLGICTGLLSFLIGIYVLFLEITAVKAVNRFGWGAAVGSVLIPIAVLVGICVCAITLGVAALVPALTDAFQQLN